MRFPPRPDPPHQNAFYIYCVVEEGLALSRRTYKPNSTEQRITTALDDLDEFQKFRAEILPKLRQALLDGKSSKEILELTKAAAAARIATIALTEPDSAKALAAAKEIHDRVDGKSTERREIKHDLANLPEEQLDAILMAKLQETQDESDESVQH